MENGVVVSLADFARELGLDRSRARKMILDLSKRQGRQYLKDGRVNRQRALVLSREDADQIISLRQQAGFIVGTEPAMQMAPVLGEPTVYVLGLHGGRIKLGFTDALAQRLAAHRTLAPDLEVLRQWPLPQAYEVVMLDLARHARGLTEIGGEVFGVSDGNALDALLARLDELVRAVGRLQD